MTTTRTLELVKTKTVEKIYKRKPVNLATYDVVLDGEVIGKVERAMLTRERRTPGRTYVDRRWQSPGWQYLGTRPGYSRAMEALSRRDAVVKVLTFYADMDFIEAEKLAETVRGVR